jgi:hypothetical protein
MNRLSLLGISLLAIAACAPQPSPPPAVTAAPAPGSLPNTTTFFDGTYAGSFVQSITPGSPTTQCPNIRVAPPLTIRNGGRAIRCAQSDISGVRNAAGRAGDAEPGRPNV